MLCMCTLCGYEDKKREAVARGEARSGRREGRKRGEW